MRARAFVGFWCLLFPNDWKDKREHPTRARSCRASLADVEGGAEIRECGRGGLEDEDESWRSYIVRRPNPFSFFFERLT